MGNLIQILTRVVGTCQGRNHQVIFQSYYYHEFLKLYISQTKKCLNFRSSHQRCSIKKAVFKHFSIFDENICVGVSFYQSCRPEGLQFYIKRLQHRCFPVNIAKLLRTPILKKIFEKLILQFLLLTVNISSQGLVSAFNSIVPLQVRLQALKSSLQGAQW